MDIIQITPPLRQGIKVRKWFGTNTELKSLSDLLLTISQGFGERPEYYGVGGHNGLDFVCEADTPIFSVHNGEASAYEEKDVNGDFVGYGKYITIRDRDNKFKTEYCHLNKVLKTGQVKAGEVIGLSGNTGNSSGPHLHFTLKNPQAIDPLPHLVWFGMLDKNLVKRIVEKLYKTWLQKDDSGVEYWSNLIDSPEKLENFIDQKLSDVREAVK
ncbi:M23 family metallopeptidase [Candidatus Woesearchaeota archaeon]|nr:M23 family metallopeptidase [Candidatus Woesearchaeota archaeon]